MKCLQDSVASLVNLWSICGQEALQHLVLLAWPGLLLRRRKASSPAPFQENCPAMFSLCLTTVYELTLLPLLCCPVLSVLP
jgi:hypothetical protein